MQNDVFNLLQSTFQKGLPFVLSFVDDALLFIATKIGLQFPWMQSLSTFLLIATLIYWSVQLWHYMTNPLKGSR